MEGLESLKAAVERFIEYAKAHTEFTFLVTPIGCGIAGYRAEEIGPLFEAAVDLENVYLPEGFLKVVLRR